ncbi:hypothetical protein HCN51_16760 [Nonomuraea sp. FMUSA5-5]|uniref:Type II toxin-antitoxin system RelE/ParE family toxin n=1 Tax=Nonomuraea composti TaxID=2720023 RepID=A0ABX1B3E7_9ACTN|nr:hypothetical protein [Nonomuraea sp. FMUSA5-5]NJP91085.1 hypothetical protein [Nonomuraea sp. FMUSA5-5]
MNASVSREKPPAGGRERRPGSDQWVLISYKEEDIVKYMVIIYGNAELWE